MPKSTLPTQYYSIANEIGSLTFGYGRVVPDGATLYGTYDEWTEAKEEHEQAVKEAEAENN